MVKLKKIITYIEAILKILFLFALILTVSLLILFYDYIKFFLSKILTELFK